MNLIRAGMYMIIGVLLIMVLYFVISVPLNSLFDSLDDADSPESNDEMDIFLPTIRTALNTGIALACALPIVIFIVRIFEREPDWYYGRR